MGKIKSTKAEEQWVKFELELNTIMQIFVPGRAGRVTDVLIDGVGLIVGALVMWEVMFSKSR